jgi:hypothetical protein
MNALGEGECDWELRYVPAGKAQPLDCQSSEDLEGIIKECRNLLVARGDWHPDATAEGVFGDYVSETVAPLSAVSDLIAAARVFVARVEAGEIRSKRTYGEFKSALDRIGVPAAREAECGDTPSPCPFCHQAPEITATGDACCNTQGCALDGRWITLARWNQR